MTKAISVVVPVLALGAILLVGCENDTTPSLFDPNATSRPAPVVSDVQPAGNAFAGIGVLTISGQNFSAVKEENFVFFDDVLGEVMQASATQLQVKAPVLVKDGIKLRISVFKAEQFSNTITYDLVAAVSDLVKPTEFDVPWAVTCDALGNVYASYVVNNSGPSSGIKRIAPDGSVSDYSPEPSGAPLRYNSMKVGPGGAIYGTTNERRISQVPPAGGAPSNWVIIQNTSVKVYDLDFDKEGNLWAAGNNTDIYRIKQDKSVTSFAFTADVRSVRIYNDHVYLGGGRTGAEKVWRLPILSADAVGPEEEYFDLSSKYTGAIQAITFAADGDLYLGTDGPESIVVVHSDKSSEPLYPGLFQSACLSFAWDPDIHLYVTQQAEGTVLQSILKVNMQKNGAPYYGRGDL